jgi:imidazolonepropionase-like amidohydrolase
VCDGPEPLALYGGIISARLNAVTTGGAAARTSASTWLSNGTKFFLEHRHQAAGGVVDQSGLKVAFGTDAAVYPHGLNAHEFATMVKMGLPPR